MHAIAAEEGNYLYTKCSQIPHAGMGLYTAIPIYKNEIISFFTGELLNTKEAKIRADEGNDAYFISLLNGKILDSMNTEGYAKYANDPLGLVKSLFTCNSKITVNEHNRVCLLAKRKIKAGEEIFCRYGAKYWQNHKTPPKRV